MSILSVSVTILLLTILILWYYSHFLFLYPIPISEATISQDFDPNCDIFALPGSMNTMIQSFTIRKNHPLLKPLSKAMRTLQIDGTIERLLSWLVFFHHYPILTMITLYMQFIHMKAHVATIQKITKLILLGTILLLNYRRVYPLFG